MAKNNYEILYMYDEPVEYKGLKIYPILMRDYFKFFYFADCFTLDKNSVNDVKVISMSYLEYMYRMNGEIPYVAFFDAILKMATRNPELLVTYGRNKKNKPIFIIGETEYNSSDFDEIKTIICDCNMVELPDDTIQKEIRDNMKKAEELRRRKNMGKMASLEDQMICVLISTSLSLGDIYLLPIRKFIKMLERVDAKLHYQIYLNATMSGLVEFKDKSFIKHWMSDLSKKKIDLVPFEQIKETMSGKSSAVNKKQAARRKK